MSASPGRRRFLVSIALLGTALIAIAAVLQWRDSKQRAVPAPEAAWRTADRNAAILERSLRPLTAGDSLALSRILATRRQFDFFGPPSTPVFFHLRRGLDSGLEFDAEIALRLRSVDSGRDIEIDVAPVNRDPVRFRIEVRGGAIAAMQQAAADSTAPWQPWTGARDLPLAVGDLPVAEVLELAAQWMGTDLEPLGFLAGMGARPQYVFEMRLSALAHAPIADAATSAVGSRALVYVDSATCEPRCVRVLDVRGYVVRIYEDPIWSEGAVSRLVQFRVTALSSSSHSVFRRRSD